MTIHDVARPAEDRLYFRQLLSGRDFAQGDQLATQMVNFVYAIGDRSTGECVLVDPAYAVSDLLDVVAADDMRVTGVLATHYHPDHIGGSMMGMEIQGIAALLSQVSCPIHVNAAEVPWVVRTSGVSESDLVAHESGDRITVGEISIELIHTPGHTPGSQCFMVDGRLVAGDTLFLDGCGRTDLPGSNAEHMMQSLSRLSKVDDDVVLFPGHRYSVASSAQMGAVKASNWVFSSLS
jgi:hydroxyacylglutathione hydrolase